MAILIPSIEEIKNSKPYPENGELKLINVLKEGLDDSYHVFFQSYLNGLHPDVVVLRDGYGVFIIEVKDWNLRSYRYDNDVGKYGRIFVQENNQLVNNPFEQVMSYKDSLYKLYLPELALEKAKNALHYGFVKVGLYFH